MGFFKSQQSLKQKKLSFTFFYSRELPVVFQPLPVHVNVRQAIIKVATFPLGGESAICSNVYPALTGTAINAWKFDQPKVRVAPTLDYLIKAVLYLLGFVSGKKMLLQ